MYTHRYESPKRSNSVFVNHYLSIMSLCINDFNLLGVAGLLYVAIIASN